MKTYKAKYTIDLDNIEKLEDIDVEFGLAKHAAGLAMSDDELKAILEKTEKEATVYVAVINCSCEEGVKKDPWYKRFWNWIKRPFSKKK